MTRSDVTPPRIIVATAPQPGAVALLQLHGPGSAALLARLTDDADFTPGRLRLRQIEDIDEALTLALREDWAQIMPHGGPRVVQKLVDRLVQLGAIHDADPDPRAMYPEADTPIEADVLATIARAASPAAIDLLAAQPALWGALHGSLPLRNFLKEVAEWRGAEIRRQSAILDRLIDPPTVVVVGRPNVGKSTLTNAMLGRAVSIVADLPGTTRDWVAGIAELTPMPPADGDDPTPLERTHAAVAVRWLDTPGLRSSDDTIEQEAITIARQVIASADILIAMRDPAIDWPDLTVLPRQPDLFVMNKADEPGAAASGDGRSLAAPLPLSARTHRGLDHLQHLILEALELTTFDPPPLWTFSSTLRAALKGDTVDLADYLGADVPR